MKISLQSHITLYELSIKKEKKNFIVEEPISGDFFEMTEITVEAIRRIEMGEGLDEIEKMLKRNYPEEEVDMVVFVEQLVELGLVQEIDGVHVQKETLGPKASGFLWIPSWVGRLLFNRVMNKVYLLLLLCNILFLILNPAFIPHYKDIFLFDSMMLNMITYLFISLVLILLHEFGHILAIRSQQLPAQLSIGTRLILIVFETDLTQAWKLDPKERNVLYFAGMAFEQVILFLSFGVMLLFPDTFFAGVLGIVVLDIFIKTIYQCCFYMKTDVYYVVENTTGYYNLIESGKEYLRSLFNRSRRPEKSDPQDFGNDFRIVRLYSVFYIIGVLLTLLLAAVYILPQIYYAYATIFSNIQSPGNDAAYWDAVIFLAQTVIMIVLLIYLNRRERLEG